MLLCVAMEDMYAGRQAAASMPSRPERRGEGRASKSSGVSGSRHMRQMGLELPCREPLLPRRAPRPEPRRRISLKRPDARLVGEPPRPCRSARLALLPRPSASELGPAPAAALRG